MHPRKFALFTNQTVFLGHLIDEEGLRPDPARVQSIVRFPSPRNVRELKRGLGMVNYFRRFIEGFSALSAPLNALLKKGNSGNGERRRNGFCVLC